MLIRGKKNGILYLDRGGFYYYSASNPTIFEFRFESTTINHLEILNKDNLVAQIKTFVESNKIGPSNLILILSENILFEKNLIDVPPDQKKIEVEKFLNSVPFETLSTKEFRLEKGIKIVAVNRDLHDSIEKAFELYGFMIEAVVPYFAFGKNVDFSQGITPEVAKLILKTINSIRQEYFLEARVIELPIGGAALSKNKLTLRSIILIGVFFALLVVLIIVVIVSFF